MFSCVFCSTENVPVRNSDVDYRLLEAAKAGDLDTVKVAARRSLFCRLDPQNQEMLETLEVLLLLLLLLLAQL